MPVLAVGIPRPVHDRRVSLHEIAPGPDVDMPEGIVVEIETGIHDADEHGFPAGGTPRPVPPRRHQRQKIELIELLGAPPVILGHGILPRLHRLVDRSRGGKKRGFEGDDRLDRTHARQAPDRFDRVGAGIGADRTEVAGTVSYPAEMRTKQDDGVTVDRAYAQTFRVDGTPFGDPSGRPPGHAGIRTRRTVFAEEYPDGEDIRGAGRFEKCREPRPDRCRPVVSARHRLDRGRPGR